ncbi:hypothetical protein ACH42_08595 [Endozoicomonas sp. (ex Bugula neritina AB1)]|nr:hypothetical protein ACH42_08595 [Endozoicomonas sp. (ex Bugula neritina AB1)]
MTTRRITHRLLLALLLFSGTLRAENFQLMTENFPPLNMSSNGAAYARNDRVSGFATDIIRKVFKKTGHDVKFTLSRQWDDAYGKALTKQGYGVYSTLRSRERESKFLWVGPLYSEDWVLLAPTDSKISIFDLNEAKKYQVGSYVFDGITDYLIQSGVDILPAQNDAVNAVKLKSNTIDLWASSSLTGPYVAANFKLSVKPVLTFNQSSLWLAMNIETPPKIIDDLNAALKAMHDSGEIQTIINSYNQ